MAENLNIISGSKEEQYASLLPQIKSLIEGETDLIANLANVTAALKETFHFFWVGFYLVKEDELVLAPFQGPIACTRIRKGKGVRDGLAGKEDFGNTGCRCVSGTYCLQFSFTIRDCSAFDERR